MTPHALHFIYSDLYYLADQFNLTPPWHKLQIIAYDKQNNYTMSVPSTYFIKNQLQNL